MIDQYPHPSLHGPRANSRTFMSFSHSTSSSVPPAPSFVTSSLSSASALLVRLLLLVCVLPCLTAAQYTSQPYVSPVCLDASFLVANKLSVPPSGPTVRPTVTLERDGWAGHYLTTSLAAQLLRDALGYTVAIVDVNSTQGDLSGVFARLAGADGATPVDMNFEVWPNQQLTADYNLTVLTDGAAINAGPSGLVQQSGWYVPTTLVNQDWIDFYDFWKGYKYTNLTAVFPAAGSTADELKAGAGREFVPSWCVIETEPAGCAPTYYDDAYLNRQCNVTVYSPYCIEMYAIDALQYDPGVIQQQITNLQLNLTIVFLGQSNYDALKATALATNAPFLAYDWTPAIDTSNTSSLTRVALPVYSEVCWSSFNGTGSLQGSGGLNCDFPIQSIFKYYSASLSNDTNAESYRDALYLLSALNFANQYQQYLLNFMKDQPMSSWQTIADKNTCSWLHSVVPIWRSWVSLSPQQYFEDIPQAAWVAVIVIVSILGAYSLLLHAFVYRYRKHPLLLSSSPFFGQVIIGGSWFLYVAIAIMRWKSIEAVCSIIPTFLCIAYTLVIGTLFAKTWRLNRIFKGASLKSVRVSAWDVVLFISALFTIDFIIIAAWLLIDRPIPVLETDSTNSLQLITVCYSEHWTVWYSLLIVPKAVEVAYGMYLAYNVRHINANFNESRYIGLAIVHLIVFSIIIIPLDLALENQLTVHYLLISLMLCLGVFVTLSLIFLPKIYAIVYKRKGQPHKRVPRAAVEDSKSDAAHNLAINSGAAGGAAGYRWMRERVMADVSESDKLSFPSLHGGGFVHAVRIVRVVAEQLYRECGIGEYWQFCVAVRNMSQQELEARAPLLVAYLQQQVTLSQQQYRYYSTQRPTHHEVQLPYNTQPSTQHQHDDDECKVAADVAVTDVGPLSQEMSVSTVERPGMTAAAAAAAAADAVIVEMPSVSMAAMPVEYADHPITQQSFSFAPSAIAASRHNLQISTAPRTSDVLPRQSMLSEDSCSLVQLPPLPNSAWTMTDDEIHKLTLPGLLLSPLSASPLSSLQYPIKHLPPHSSSTSTLLHSQLSPSSLASALPSYPLTTPLPALSEPHGQSYASQLSFSTSHHSSHSHPNGPSVSIPSPSESSVPFSSTHSPTSPNNHLSTTDSGGTSESGSLRGSAVDSEAASRGGKPMGVTAGMRMVSTSDTETFTP